MTITQDYEALRKRFLPEFGNIDHIYISNLIGKLDKAKKDLVERKKQGKNTDKFEKEIQNMKQYLILKLTRTLK